MTSDKEYNDVNQNILETFGTMNAPTSTISCLHDEFNYMDEHHARYERDGYLSATRSFPLMDWPDVERNATA